MNYSEVINSIVIYGGRNDTLFEKNMNLKENFLSDLWILNLETVTWCKLNSVGEIP